MIERGCRFVWCSDAIVFETVPPIRWRRTFMLRKALLRGASAALSPKLCAGDILKSAVAVPLYGLVLPFALMLGQHHFMNLAVKICDHLGKLLTLAGINPVHGQYVTE
jgi:succinoglycan biosynthesis protein ExoM